MGWKIKSVVFFCFCFSTQRVTAQSVNRYIIFFKDKANTAFSISQPQQFLSIKAIDRRSKQHIAITEEDFPVNTSYVAQVKATGAKTFFTSRWMNCLLVETDAARIEQIKLLPSVIDTEFAAPNKKLSSARVNKFKRIEETSFALATLNQLQLIGLNEMHADGYAGEGINIAVLDSGFPGVNTALPFQSIFKENRIIDSYDFIAKSGNVYSYDSHGTEILSVIGAYSENSFIGGAYKANFQLYVTEDAGSEYRIEEYNWLFAAERADSVGVDVINSSLGYNTFDDASMDYTKNQLDGKTAVISRAAAKAISKGIVVVCSAGNEGSNTWKLVTPPADVDGILAIGSVTSTGTKSTFSSVGPTYDKRIKPDVMAMGSGTSVIRPSGTLGTASGTSVASPLIASLAAGIVQANPGVTAQQVYRSIIHSASQITKPDNQKGYGIPMYAGIKEYFKIPYYEEVITIYPNPVMGELITIVIKNPSDEAVSLVIYTVEGKVIAESSLIITWLNNPFAYDLSAFAPGTYVIKVTSGEHVRTVRFVKS